MDNGYVKNSSNKNASHFISKIGFVAGLIFFTSTALSTPPDNDSTKPVTNTTANSILTITSGYTPSITSGSTITINATCPTGYTEYVTVSANKFSTPSSDLLAGFKACVSASSHNTTTAYATIVTSVTYHDSSDVSAGYVGTNTAVWTVWDTEAMPRDDTISDSQTGTTLVGAIYWTLYCYPPNIPRPTYSCP